MNTIYRLFIVFTLLFISETGFTQTPTVQVSNVAINSRTDDAFTVSWTGGNGTYVLVVIRPFGNTNNAPVTGLNNNYTASSTYGGGTNLGNSNYVVYNGTGTSVTITNLSPSTQYAVIAYEYNRVTATFPFTGYNYYYNTSVGSANLEGAYTLCTPTTSSVNNQSASSITYNSATISWTKVSGYNTFTSCDNLTGGSNLSYPADGTNYTASTIYGNGSLLSGDNRVVYNSSGTSFNLSNLSPATTYRIRMWAFCGATTGATFNYSTAYEYFDFTTLNNPPTLSTITNRTVCMNSGATVVSLSGISDGSSLESQNVTVTATSSNTTLIPNGNISISYSNPSTSGSLTFTPAANQSGTTTISVTVNDGFSSTNTITRTFTVTVNPYPSAAGSITGNTTVCKNGSNYVYSVPAIANATGYNWSFPTGTVIVSGSNTNSITVNFPASMSQTSGIVSVYGTNSFGCGTGITSSKTIYFDKAPTVATAGSDQVICNGTTVLQGNSPSTGTGLWTVTSGSASFNNASQYNTNATGIASGATVTLTWTISNGVCPASSDAVNISYNPSAPQCLAYADFIASNTNPCVGVTVNFSDNSVGATGWSWNFGPNATPTTSTLQNPSVVFNAAGPQTISLGITGPNGPDNETKSNYINVIDVPGNASAISGLATVCAGETQVNYSINPVSGATTYNWSVPTNAVINSGDGTEAITVNYGSNAVSGTIMVEASNSCGTGNSSSLSVTVDPLPSDPVPVSGDLTVCQGENGVVYTINPLLNTSNYNWTIPSGASISAGSNTNSITVDYSTSAISGDISVYGSNACGNGAQFDVFVTVDPLPDAADVISGPAILTQCPNSNGMVYTVNAINNATGYNWDLPSGTVITAGSNTNSITVDFPYGTSDYLIAVNGTNACGSGLSNTLQLVFDQMVVQELCLVSVNESSDHNLVIWEKTPSLLIDSFRIYREVAGLGFTHIASVHYDSLSSFEDTDAGVDPNITQYRYKISAVDTCGNEGPLSGFHQTIYTFPPLVSGNDIILDWEAYDGLALPGFYYRIMRDTGMAGNWEAIDSVPEFTTVYTDLNAMNAGDTLRYYIEVVVPDVCEATRAINHNSTRSNRTQPVQGNSVSVQELFSEENMILSPNPAMDKVAIRFDGHAGQKQIELFDLEGRLIHTEQWTGMYGELNISGFESGVYIVRATINGQTVHKRLIKQ